MSSQPQSERGAVPAVIKDREGTELRATRGRVAFIVLGCAKNQVEAESMSSRLARLGWELTADVPNASVVVVHTCGFLEAARREALKTISDLRKAAPRSFLVMTGCFAQYLGGKTPPGVDALLGTGEFHLLPEVMARGSREKGRPLHLVRSRRDRLLATNPVVGRMAPPPPPQSYEDRRRPIGTKSPPPPPQSYEDRRRPIGTKSPPAGYHDAAQPRPLRHQQLSAYLRVSEGCNHRCTFCVIPQLRGNLKSRPTEEILLEGRGLVDRGIREISLISQDTSDYGRDLNPPAGLTDLLRKFLPWGDLRWLRLLYVYPSEVTDELIDLLAQEEMLCGYLDMPLQHISDRILRSMKRDWGRKETMALLDRLRKRVPHLTLRTTFMVGFPGEIESDFRWVLDVVEAGHFDHVGVFPYSLENRSPSALLPDAVPAPVVEERWNRLLSAQTKVKERRFRSQTGKVVTVLAEKDPEDRWTVRGRHQAPEVDGRILLARSPDRAGFYPSRLTGFRGINETAELLTPVPAGA